MDVSELLAPGPGLSTATIVLIAGAIIGVVLAIAGIRLSSWKPDSDFGSWIVISGLVLIGVGCLGGALSAYIDQEDRGDMFQSALFDGYGFVAENPSPVWNSISDAGEAGTVTKLSREGVEQGVRIHLEGTRLVITGPDGKEIPANP